MDTIFALASARGKAGVAVIRLSGPASHAVVAALCGSVPPVRQASLRTVCWKGEELDRALILVFREGASFTGEAAAELHLHGSGAILRSVLRALSDQPGCRLAEPGEFTRRALEGGRLDLAEVEGLADLIDAETEAQRRQAMRVFSGAIGLKVEVWRRDLIRAAALLEATIDFAEEDVPVDVRPEVMALLTGVLADLRAEVEGVRAAERIRDGFEVAIVGAPNVGKSTLLNRLAGREAAITSEVAGTTRDVIEVRMEIDGYAVTLLDTAGIRDSLDAVEQIGVARGKERAAMADMRLFLTEAGNARLDLPPQPGDLVLLAKCDRLEGTGSNDGIKVSGQTGVGIPALVAAIGKELSGRVSGAATVTNARHKTAIETSIGLLTGAVRRLEVQQFEHELVAQGMREGLMALETILGHVDVEDVLDQIFASFCIGK